MASPVPEAHPCPGLVGAWLGLNAGEGFLAVVTTIAGAAAGANLALIVLDIIWDRSVTEQAPATTSSLSGPVVERHGV